MVKLALLVTQFGVCGSTFVLGPTMLGEFTPPARRGAVIAIYQAVIGLAGVVAPAVMGNVLDGAATPLEGYLRGYELVAVVLALAGVAGLALLRPGEERERMLRASGGSRSPLASTDEA
jgi:MFS family permease